MFHFVMNKSVSECTKIDTTLNVVRPAGMRGKLVLRGLGRGEVWYWQCQFRGRRYNQSLGTNVKKQAVELAREKESALFEGRLEAFRRGMVKQEDRGATFAQVLELYPEYCGVVQLARRTLQSNVLSLGWLLGRVGIVTSAHIGAVSQEALVAAAEGIKGVSFMSRLRQARSVFSRDALQFYAAKGLRVEANPFPLISRRIEGRGAMPKKRIPPEQVRAPILAGLAGHENAEIRMAYYLCYGLALRRSEAVAAGPGWLIEVEGQVYLDVRKREGFTPKGVDGTVPVPGQIVDLLRGVPGDTFLEGRRKARLDVIDRALPAAMRELGWEGPKFAHELRAWRGSDYYTQYGAEHAQDMLRHASITTTYKHYADLTKRRKALDL
jgi:integrase